MIPRMAMAALVGLALCVGHPTNAVSFPHAELGRQILERHIRPTYEHLAASFSDLHMATQYACADGTASSGELDAVVAAYRKGVLAWARASHLRLGAVTEQNRFERIAFWPDRKGRGRRQVKRLLREGAAGTEPALTVEALARKSVAVQGLTAFEVLLYGTRAGSTRRDNFDPFACSFAQAIGANLEEIANSVLRSWQDGGAWSQRWLTPGEGNSVYLSYVEVTREFAHAFLHGMQELRERHLIAPLGFVRGRLGRIYRPVFAASELSTTYLRGGVAGLWHMYDAGGLAPVLRAFDAQQTEVMEGHFRDTLIAAKKLDAVPAGALAQDPVREHAISMGFPMKSVMFHMSALLQQHASLSLGFNASDGD